MAVVHHDEHVHTRGDNGMGFLMGVLVLAVVLFLLFYYGLPILRSGFSTSTPQINVPGQIDVNVNQK